MKILIADDSEIMRNMVATCLEQAGHVVAKVKNGGQAIVEALTQDFDLIITDLQMPGANGLTVIERVKREKPSARIILVSLEMDQHVRVAAQSLGAEEAVHKACLRDVLEKKGIFR